MKGGVRRSVVRKGYVNKNRHRKISGGEASGFRVPERDGPTYYV
jgi:hypothetical protein